MHHSKALSSSKQLFEKPFFFYGTLVCGAGQKLDIQIKEPGFVATTTPRRTQLGDIMGPL